MSKTLNGAFAHTQNTAFVSPYFEQSSPLGMCLKAVTEPVSSDALRTAKSEINTILAQVADALDVIAERENLANQYPPPCFLFGWRTGRKCNGFNGRPASFNH